MSKVIKAINYLKEFSKIEGIDLLPISPEQKTAAVNDPVDMNIESYLALAKNIDCKILYYETTLFTADDFEEYIEYLDQEFRAEEITVEDNKWHKSINEFVGIKIIFYYNGVSHVFQLKEDELIELEQGYKYFNYNNLKSN